jgi:23S rRNA (cytidine1920-2'-O)/16S rRNA (cytidine1409-2'-O)-methyltransferase
VKKGFVKDPTVHTRVCAEIAEFLERACWRVLGTLPSPIAGGDGNREFLIAAERI